MSTATRVPETSLMAPGELSADDAMVTLRRVGRRKLTADSFRRFRFGDGFTEARALGFQLALALIPLLISVVGLSASIRNSQLAQAMRDTLLSFAPGGGGDALRQALENGSRGGGSGRLAFVLGLGVAVYQAIMAMGQLERGANRIYGVERDRDAQDKYRRAAWLGPAVGAPALLGFLLMVAGGRAVSTFAETYGWPDGLRLTLQILCWPIGALLALVAITVIFRTAPRRYQPSQSWLAFGAGLTLVLWLVFSGLLALYVANSSTFGRVYGPLTSVLALLLWCQLTSMAIFLGIAFAAQLEAVRAGVRRPDVGDPEPEDEDRDSDARRPDLDDTAPGKRQDATEQAGTSR